MKSVALNEQLFIYPLPTLLVVLEMVEMENELTLDAELLTKAVVRLMKRDIFDVFSRALTITIGYIERDSVSGFVFIFI